MADPTMYAWSPIQGSKGDKQFEVPAGEAVNADKLGLSKEQFQQLVDAGSVRPVKFPDLPEGYRDSPVNYLREQAIEAAGEGDEAVLAVAASNLEPGTPQASPARPDRPVNS